MDRHQIAARVRELIANQAHVDLADIAAELGVEELSLRMTIDPLSPHPTVEVLAALALHLGVDPTWLLTGEYDMAQHRSVLEGGPKAVADAVRQLASQRETPSVLTPRIHLNRDRPI
jgi:hypothetical protein